mgnify:CR=1 FL=1
MIVTINKCVMHKFGFKLNHLAIDGIDKTYNGSLRSSGDNTCLGKTKSILLLDNYFSV